MQGMNWLLDDIACILACELDISSDVYVQRIVTDSRQVQAGDCFVALVGERVDGHDFLSAVMALGAVAAIVTRFEPACPLPQLVVSDAVGALQHLAAIWRSQFSLSPCIAVTGSNGKTSVKEMIASILPTRDDHRVLATQGNLNNHLGLPMTLLNLRRTHCSAVIEVGANHMGEIAQLAPLVQPNTAIITSIGVAHIGEFGSLDAIIQAKGEIWSALDEGGFAIIPALSRDMMLRTQEAWSTHLTDKRVIVFGLLDDVLQYKGCQSWVGIAHRQVMVDGEQVIDFVTSDWSSAQLTLPIMGEHQANNLAAVVAALLPNNFSWEQIQQGISALRLPDGRLRVLHPTPNLLLIDDTYNANPASMLAAIKVLMEQPAQQHILVIGSMGELGHESEAYHRDVAIMAAQAGVDQLLVSGLYQEIVLQNFPRSGLASDDPEYLAQQVWQSSQQYASVAVIVKGSRSSRMERVVMALCALATEKS